MKRFVFLSLFACSFALAAGEEMKPFVEKITGTDFVLEMTPIPGGTFKLGSPDSEAGRAENEGPQVEVEIKPFYMSTFEVRWGLFRFYAIDEMSEDVIKGADLKKDKAGVSASDAVTRPTSIGHNTTVINIKDNDEYPAACMTHHSAMEFCRWLSAKTGKPYRLATEAEWEYACRAGSATPYSFGGDSAVLKEFAWHAGNSDGQAQPVGKKKPNAWGLHDMHGNVREWVIDLYDASVYSKWSKAKQLGPVVIPGSEVYGHVARGGSWSDEPAGCRSAARYVSDESWSQQDPNTPKSIWWHTEATWVGIRVVCPVEEQENLKGLKSGVEVLPK